jgi:hypothetical protein
MMIFLFVVFKAEDWMLHFFGIIAMSAEIGSERNGFWPSADRIPLDSSMSYKAILSVAMKTGKFFSPFTLYFFFC